MTNTILSRKQWILMLLSLLSSISIQAQENANTRQARQIFDKAYNTVFGPQGCDLSYAVNIIGIYKTEGTIWMKGKKQKFTEPRFSAWCDGKDFYRVDKKKKTIEIHNPNSAKRDKYASKFKFEPNNYTYHITAKGNDFIITLEARKGVDGIKHAKGVLDKRTREPKSLRIKVMLFWCTVRISHFHSGIDDERIFHFPMQKFKGYEIIDKRPD